MTTFTRCLNPTCPCREPLPAATCPSGRDWCRPNAPCMTCRVEGRRADLRIVTTEEKR